MISLPTKALKAASAHTFALYWDGDDHFTSDGRDASACHYGEYEILPPRIDVVVRAKSLKQAAFFANNSVTSCSRGDALGVWWDREVHSPEPPPLGRDLRQWWCCVAWCRSTTVTMWSTREEAGAAKRWIGEVGCGSGCWRSHEVMLLTKEEIRRLHPEWVEGARRAPSGR